VSETIPLDATHRYFVFIRLEVRMALDFFRVGYELHWVHRHATKYFITVFSNKFGLWRASCLSTRVVTFSLPDTVPELLQITSYLWESARIYTKK